MTVDFLVFLPQPRHPLPSSCTPCLPLEGLPFMSASLEAGMEKVHSCPVLLPCLVLLLRCPAPITCPLRTSKDPPSPLGKPASAPILLGMTHLFNEAYSLSCPTLPTKTRHPRALTIHRGRIHYARPAPHPVTSHRLEATGSFPGGAWASGRAPRGPRQVQA